MTHSACIVRGNTSININSGSIIMLEYHPTSPNLSTIDTNDTLRDGAERTNISRRNVSETMRLLIHPARGDSPTIANTTAASRIQSAIRLLSGVFWGAEIFQETNQGNRAYLKMIPSGATSPYQTEIITARIEPVNAEAFGRPFITACALEVAMTFTRRHYWEGINKIALNLINPRGSASVGSLVNNTEDGTTVANWVQISASDVQTELPAPLHVVFTNEHASKDIRHLYYGANWTLSPSNFAFLLQGEDSKIGTTSSCDSTYSGSYIQTSVSTAGANFIDLFCWEISSSQFEHAAGAPIRMLASFDFSGVNEDIVFRWKFTSGGIELWKGDSFQVDDTLEVTLRDLGTVYFPPWAYLGGEHKTASLTLEGKYFQGISGASTPKIDFIQLIPGYDIHYVDFYGQTLDQTLTTFNLDDIDKYIWVGDPSGASRISSLRLYGNDIPLYPGFDQKFFFLWHFNTLNDNDISGTARVSMYYKPRILTI